MIIIKEIIYINFANINKINVIINIKELKFDNNNIK